MWILLVIWIFFSVDGNVINECRLVLHALATAVCQLYLTLLPLRHAAQHFAKAAQHFAKAAWNILIVLFVYCLDEMLSSKVEERLWCLLPLLRKAAFHFLEGVCLLWESLSQFLAVVSSLCVAVKHVLQGALFLIVSTVRWAQQKLLFKDDVDEWVKEQNQQTEQLQEQRRQVEEYLYPVDQLTGKKRLRGVDKR